MVGRWNFSHLLVFFVFFVNDEDVKWCQAAAKPWTRGRQLLLQPWRTWTKIYQVQSGTQGKMGQGRICIYMYIYIYLDSCATLIIWYVLENICIQTDNFHCGSPLGEVISVLSVGWWVFPVVGKEWWKFYFSMFFGKGIHQKIAFFSKVNSWPFVFVW